MIDSMGRVRQDHYAYDDGTDGAVRIRTRSLPNVSTARLKRRLAWFDRLLADPAQVMARFDGRKPMRELAREIINVRWELDRRMNEHP